MRYLYTYLPRENTAQTQGILSTAKAPSGWQKYKQRSGKTTKQQVLAYLDSLDKDRSKAFSAFSAPIPADSDPVFVQFAKKKELYKVDLARLLKAKRILSIYKTGIGKATHRVDKVGRTSWKDKHPGDFLFSNVPHYIVAVKDGVVPTEYIEKQASKTISFPQEQLQDLRKRLQKYQPIWTTRVSKDRTAYNKGDVLQNSLINQPLYVSETHDISSLQQHPFQKFLTPAQKELLKKYKKMRILKLKPYSWGDNPIYNQTMGTEGKRYRIARLIKAIKQHKLKPSTVSIQDIGALNQKVDNTWGNGVYKEAPQLTVKQFAEEHLPRILKADLQYPILVSQDKKYVYDGLHRLMKAMLQNRKKIKAYRVPKNYLKQIQETI